MKVLPKKRMVRGAMSRVCAVAILALLGVTVSVAAGAALGVGTVLPVSAHSAAAAPADTQGAWLLTVTKNGHTTGDTMVSSFAAGHVLSETDSNKPGTGLGRWTTVGTDGFAFTYLKYLFGSNGKLNTAIKGRASGTFHGSSLTGQVSFVPVDPYGHQGGPVTRFSFIGKRITVQAP